MKLTKLLPLFTAGLLTTCALDLAAQHITLLHTFSTTAGISNWDGAGPRANLVLSGNTLYGTAPQGGSNGYGAVFSISTNGSNFTVLHTFTGGSDAGGPDANLVLAGDTLYGTEGRGTNLGASGSVFSVSTNGSNFALLYTFTTNATANGALGSPNPGVIISGGTLYGAAWGGGISNAGTIFSVSTNGTNFQLLHQFNSFTDGGNPLGGMVISGGTLYGTARNGGSNGLAGTVFSVGTDGGGFTVLHTFSPSPSLDGKAPDGDLILSGNTLYGTTFSGGTNGMGTVFSINTDGSNYTVIHSFNTAAGEGKDPEAGLFLRGNTLYGTTIADPGGINGTIYSVNTDGSSFTVLHTFSIANASYSYTNSDGAQPFGAVAMSGNILYGTTSVGGVTGLGTVFSFPIVPQITGLSLSATNLVLSGINALAGNTYAVLASTNVILPLYQWQTVSTNLLSSGGNFTLTATNAVDLSLPQRFYILQSQ